MNKTVHVITTVVAFFLAGCGSFSESGASKSTAETVFAKATLQERIAREFAEASPLADPADARARDAAAARLAESRNFRAATGEKVVWGGFDPAKGYDPKAYLLTEFEPLVWLKLYASTIMFSGEHEVRKEGPFTVLEMKAKFRSGLDAGDYPYPFWHAPKKWQGYLDLDSVAMVFDGKKIIAAFRIPRPEPSRPLDERPWDGKWQWTDAKGTAQPRVALFSYMFAADNPHRESVDGAYRKFEEKFRGQNCHSCHSPDNKGKSKELFMMNYPNQALIGRHRLVQTLKENKMPPENTEKHSMAGIRDEAARADLIRLAQAFAKEADAAVAFESARKPAMGEKR